MSRYRMCRWHTAECKPDFHNIQVDGYRTNVPQCRRCGRSPPLQELIPKLARDWQPNAMPEDEQLGQMNLHWPESVFGSRNVPIQLGVTPTSDERFVHVEVNGIVQDFEMVDDAPLSSSELRLMHLSVQTGDDPVCVSLETFHDRNIPEFEALSYSLGGENRKSTPSNPIYIGPHRDIMLLTETCEAMLKFLCPNEGESSRPLWFDYLCINQSDMVERDRQLPKMRSIYSGCTRVIVYLGDDLVQKLGPGQHRPRHWLHEIDKMEISKENGTSLTLKDILSRGYFKRTWIIQEILLAETAVIPIGQYNFRASAVALNRLDFVQPWDWEDTKTPWMQYMGQASVGSSSLYEALRLTWGSEVTDRRDRIFGVLGLVPDDPEFRPDSSISWIGTFIGTCAHLIKKVDTHLLLKSRGKTAAAAQLTWMPNFNDPELWHRKDMQTFFDNIDLDTFRERYYQDLKEPDDSETSEKLSSSPRIRADFICHRPYSRGRGSDVPLVPEIGHLAVCPSSGALCLRLARLITVKTLPQHIDHLGYFRCDPRLRAFKFGTEECWLVVTTVDGPLDELHIGDEIFLHTGTSNQFGILFALRRLDQYAQHTLLFACVCVDAVLLLSEHSLHKCRKLGTPTKPFGSLRTFANNNVFRSTFGRNLSSVLEETLELSRTGSLDWTRKQREIHDYLTAGWSLQDKLYAHATTPLQRQEGDLGLHLELRESEIWPLAQAMLDDDLHQEDNTDLEFLLALQNVLRKRLPGLTIEANGETIVVHGFPPDCVISLDEDINHRHDDTLPEFVAEDREPSVLPPQGWVCDVKVLRWHPEIIKIPSKPIKRQLCDTSIVYHKLQLLSGFRGLKNGCNETELLEQYQSQTSQPQETSDDEIFSIMNWACGKEMADAMGLGGEVKDVWIH